MNTRVAMMATILCLVNTFGIGQQTASPAPRVITLHEAVDLALKRNHLVA
jgi:hypothetical protein